MKNAHLLHMAQPASHTPDAAMFSVIMDPAFLAPGGASSTASTSPPLLGEPGAGEFGSPAGGPLAAGHAGGGSARPMP